MRGSPAVCADEPGWRESGDNGHLWTFGTPTLRLFHYAHSRAGAVVQEGLGAVSEGTLSSDFYVACTIHDGPHQRCWVRLLRDTHDLRAAHPDDAALATWAGAVHDLYLEAKQVAAGAAGGAERAAARDDLERRLTAVCRDGWQPSSALPQATLCQRIDRFLDGLFEFVLGPALGQQPRRAQPAAPGHRAQDQRRQPLRRRLHGSHGPRLPLRHPARPGPRSLRRLPSTPPCLPTLNSYDRIGPFAVPSLGAFFSTWRRV